MSRELLRSEIERAWPNSMLANGQPIGFRSAVVRNAGTQQHEGEMTSQKTKFSGLLPIPARCIEVPTTFSRAWRSYDESSLRLFSTSGSADKDGRGVECSD